jgi:hypothetical protein
MAVEPEEGDLVHYRGDGSIPMWGIITSTSSEEDLFKYYGWQCWWSDGTLSYVSWGDFEQGRAEVVCQP